MFRPISCALIVLELAALGIFLFSAHKVDSFLPEYGGDGDATSIFLWSDRANLAFLSLASLWLLALARVLYLAFPGNGRKNASMSERVGTIDAHAVAIPVIGLIIGYLFLPTIGS